MKQIKVDDPTLLVSIKDWLEQGWWQGFSERDNSRDPTILEKQQMIRYPHISSIVQLSYLPLLSAKITIKGDEEQKKVVNQWLSRYYRRLLRMVCEKAFVWGYSVAERVFNPVEIDGKTYWMLKGLICPPPYQCKLKFKDSPISIDGFEYNNKTVDRYGKKDEQKIPGMVYYAFRGDEISLPYGNSLFNDFFWAWQLVMKTWTTASVYERLHAPAWILYYMSDLKGGDTKAVDLAKDTADNLLADIKNMGGISIPKTVNLQGEPVKGWEFEEITSQDKEPQFMERINTLNTMMYIGALMPERVIEQFKGTGSEAMVKVQRDFYEDNVLGERVEEHQEYIREWFINPLLQLNFGKIDLEIDIKLRDRMIEFYAEILQEVIRGGNIPSIDLNKMAEKIGLPMNIGMPQPEVIEEERKQFRGTEFQARPSMKQVREKVGKIARPWIEKINNKLDPIKKDVYNSISTSLKQIQGSMGLKVMNLKDSILKTDDLASLVQIPRNAFSSLGDGLDASFNIGMEFIIKGGKGEMPDAIPGDAVKELRLIQKKFEGIGGRNVIGGQPELLEERLFFAIMNAMPIDNRVNAFNQAFDNYIGLTLVDNVANELNIALNMGIRYGAKELQRQKQIEMKEGI